MGQCCGKSGVPKELKQSYDIDDKRVFKFGAEILNKDFSLQLGYHRRATKNYTGVQENVDNIVQENVQDIVQQQNS